MSETPPPPGMTPHQASLIENAGATRVLVEGVRELADDLIQNIGGVRDAVVRECRDAIVSVAGSQERRDAQLDTRIQNLEGTATELVRVTGQLKEFLEGAVAKEHQLVRRVEALEKRLPANEGNGVVSA